MYILGLNAYHGDSSAAIIKDGKLIAAIEEERLNRIKHWSGFPFESIKFCLDKAEVSLQDIDYIALNRDARANLHKKFLFVLTKRPSLNLIKNRFTNMRKVADIISTFSEKFDIDSGKLKNKIIHVEHHTAHLASSFFVSEFNEAALVSIDGFGDFTSVMAATGRGNNIEPIYQVNYPHSLGVFYSALTQFLGFPKYGDEYRVMGLAGFGSNEYLDKMKEIVQLLPKGRFKLNLKYFQHYRNIDNLKWYNTAPDFGRLYSNALTKLFGPPRKKDEAITDHHKNIAASAQALYESALFHILNHVYRITETINLCLSGGCAMNSLANGKIFDKTSFTDIYIPAGAYDAGGAIGASFFVYNQLLNNPRSFIMNNTCYGPQYTSDFIGEILEERKEDIAAFSITKYDDYNELISQSAKHLANGEIVGWFQGRMEWGARALGNRSILADPRREDMRDIINSKIKFREMFRPFAPSIMEEYVGDYFECDYPAPFMQKVYPIKKEQQHLIPAVTHVDGTGRLQTVNQKQNPLYWQLINSFYKLTSVPMVLNTSFNENEPIVCNPQEALNCFLRTDMDIIVIENFIIKR
ncbi:MAG: carbamoyltransferase [Flavobacteriaceae bacterium]|nr:carbamoyltransferase [Flavobacteriaceae bacterium]